MSSQWIIWKDGRWVKKNIMKITIDGATDIVFLEIDYSSAPHLSRVLDNYTKNKIFNFKEYEIDENYIINDDSNIVFAIDTTSVTLLEIGHMNEKNVFVILYKSKLSIYKDLNEFLKNNSSNDIFIKNINKLFY